MIGTWVRLVLVSDIDLDQHVMACVIRHEAEETNIEHENTTYNICNAGSDVSFGAILSKRF